MAQIRPGLPARPESLTRLRQALDRLCEAYGPQFLETDPLKFVHRYRSARDREVAGLVASSLAFGRVRGIFRSCEKVFALLGAHPAASLRQWPGAVPADLASFRHRWITGEDLHVFFLTVREILARWGSLERFFAGELGAAGGSLEDALDSVSFRFRKAFARYLRRETLSPALRFLVPAPRGGGSCKRMNLFLRWMVRKEPPDIGGWSAISPAALFVPLDTHMGRLARTLGLTSLKVPSWRMVREVTEGLRRINPADPIRYDFALTRPGIMGRCLHRFDAQRCPACALRAACSSATSRGRPGDPPLTLMTR